MKTKNKERPLSPAERRIALDCLGAERELEVAANKILAFKKVFGGDPRQAQADLETFIRMRRQTEKELGIVGAGLIARQTVYIGTGLIVEVASYAEE